MTQNTSRSRTLITTAILGSGMIGLGPAGCGTSENHRTTVGQTVAIPAVSDPAPAIAHEYPATGGNTVVYDRVRSDPPTLRGLSRDHWAKAYLPLPTDGLAHRPTYRFGLACNPAHDSNPDQPGFDRRMGYYPTALTALDTDGRGVWGETWYGLIEGFWGVGEAAWMPVAAVLDHPYTVRHSPSWSYEREPAIAEASIEADTTDGSLVDGR